MGCGGEEGGRYELISPLVWLAKLAKVHTLKVSQAFGDVGNPLSYYPEKKPSFQYVLGLDPVYTVLIAIAVVVG